MDKILGHDYVVRNSCVYWGGSILKGADCETFQVLNEFWAKDKNHVYTYDIKRRGVDIETFLILNLLFAKDKYFVFYLEGKAQKVEDPASFEVLDDGQINSQCSDYIEKFSYARDKNKVYCYSMGEGKPKVLRGANRNTFKVIEYGYAVDDKKVFCRGFRLKNADPRTFIVLGRHHSRDMKYAYYGDILIEKAKPETFRPLKGLLSRDEKHLYLRDDKIEGSDPDNFNYIKDEFILKDDVYVFVHGKIHPHADAKSFVNIGESIYQKDKNYIYCDGEILKGSHYGTFEIIDNVTAKDKNTYYRSDMKVDFI